MFSFFELFLILDKLPTESESVGKFPSCEFSEAEGELFPSATFCCVFFGFGDIFDKIDGTLLFSSDESLRKSPRLAEISSVSLAGFSGGGGRMRALRSVGDCLYGTFGGSSLSL